MKETFINSSLNFIQKYQECDELKIKKLKYGLEGLYSLILKLSTCFILSTILGSLIETFLFLIFYTGIRAFSYGMHAKSNAACWFSTIIIYTLLPASLKFFNITIPTYVQYIILAIAFISMILWAPADTPKRPLIRANQRKKCKFLSIIMVMIYLIITIFSHKAAIKNAIMLALIVQIIFINPISYKITKTQFNNYKYYKKKNS